MRTLVIILVLVSLIGLVDASYLTTEHYQGGAVVCNIGEVTFGDCTSVLTSEYATVFGIPNALVGAIYYLIVFILSALLVTPMPNKKIVVTIAILTGLGLTVSLWFVYLMLFVLDAICVYCMVSAAATTVLFITSLFLLKHFKKEGAEGAPSAPSAT